MTALLAETPRRCGAALDFGRVRCARLEGHPGRHAGPAPGAPGLLAETPDVSVKYCPACEPKRDPLVGVVIEQRCARHRVGLGGLDDDGVRIAGVGFGLGGEAHGVNCRAVAEMIRRVPAETGRPRE